MENTPKDIGKRRGRPPKFSTFDPIAQTNVSLADQHAGNRDASAAGIAASATGAVPTWDELKKAVQSYKSWRNSVSMAFFPNPPEDSIETQCGWVRVVSGAPRIQMNSGQEIFL